MITEIVLSENKDEFFDVIHKAVNEKLQSFKISALEQIKEDKQFIEFVDRAKDGDVLIWSYWYAGAWSAAIAGLVLRRDDKTIRNLILMVS